MPAPSREQVTRILAELEHEHEHGARDEPRAASELLPLVYDELRRLARLRLGNEPNGPTLQATALVHETYLRLVGDEDVGWTGRAHFFGAAALAMRRILVERARARGRLRHGGGMERITLADAALLASGPDLDLLALDEALERLKAHDARKSEVVMLRFFAGLELVEIARALEVSLATVKNDWSYARAWLHRELTRAGTCDSKSLHDSSWSDGTDSGRDSKSSDGTDLAVDSHSIDGTEPTRDSQSGGGTEPIRASHSSSGTEPIRDLQSSGGTHPIRDSPSGDGAQPIRHLKSADGSELSS